MAEIVVREAVGEEDVAAVRRLYGGVWRVSGRPILEAAANICH